MELSSESTTGLSLRLANTCRDPHVDHDDDVGEAASDRPLHSNLMDDITSVLIRVMQATCLILKLLYFTVYCLFIVFFTHTGSRTRDESTHQLNVTIISILSQFLFVLFTIIVGIISSVTGNRIEARIYAASSFVLFSLNLIKYGLPFMDPVIFSLDCLLLVLACVGLSIKIEQKCHPSYYLVTGAAGKSSSCISKRGHRNAATAAAVAVTL
jgi:hypothetical protein